MKGKSIFTRSEADAIITLVRQKLQADKQEQKNRRNKIRKIGFYASDFGLGGGYDVNDFLKVITIVTEEQTKTISQSTFKNEKIAKRKDYYGNNQVKSLEPICDKNSQILILGTMPGVESLKKQEYYSHPRNIFWKLIAEVIGEPAPIDYKERKQYLLKNGIALWDMCKVCIRSGSLDNNAADEEPNNIPSFVAEHSHIKLIGCNGKAAYEMFQKYVDVIAGIKVVKLPSSSPTNTTITWEEKLKFWKGIRI
jgi:hypoxanthine-DNA glycosylase